jgi:hypothetical protein
MDKGKETSYPRCLYDDKKSVLEELGLLYEGYFLYYEELDFAERVKEQVIKFIFNRTLFFIKNLFLLVK